MTWLGPCTEQSSSQYLFKSGKNRFRHQHILYFITSSFAASWRLNLSRVVAPTQLALF